MLTVPLRAQGTGENGQEFICEAKTISVNRHGARIQLDRRLEPGSRIRLTNLANPAEAEFRVVAFLGVEATGVAEWGVEATDPQSDFWGIYFPYPSKSGPQISALAQCQQCHTVALLRVSEIEAGVLESGARVSAPCQRCGAETAWGSADKILPQVSAAFSAPAPVPARANERRHARHYVQRPLTIRDASGATEKTRTENVSHNGLCCTSERSYETGQAVTLSWPHDSTGAIYEVQARVRRRHDLGGSVRKIYGFDFESPPLLRPAVARPPRGLSWQFGMFIAAGAALACAAVFRLAANFEFTSQNWPSVLELAAAVPLFYFAARIDARLARADAEKVRRPASRRAAALGALALTAAVLAAGALGFRQRSLRARDRQILQDLLLTRSLERRLDAEEQLHPATAGDYSDMCATLRSLTGQWNPLLARWSSGLALLAETARGNDERGAQLQGLSAMVGIDQEKTRIISMQVALNQEAAQLPQPQRLAFWQANFNALQDQYQQLSARRDAIVASITDAR